MLAKITYYNPFSSDLEALPSVVISFNKQNGGLTELYLVQGMGSDMSAVMSQAAVTDELGKEKSAREAADQKTLEAAKICIEQKIADIVNGSPEALDTLMELSQALGNDPNFAATMAAHLGRKVDKIEGKKLSTEDYTTAEKSKLARVAANANNYVHPADHPAAMIAQDAAHRFVSDAEKKSWNDKLQEPHFVVTSNEEYALAQRDGKVYIVIDA